MALVTPITSSSLPVLESRILKPAIRNGLPDLGNARIAGITPEAAAAEKADDAVSVATNSLLSEDHAVLHGALSAVNKIASDLKESVLKLATVAAGTAQSAAIQQEIDNLKSSYQAVLGSEAVQTGVALFASAGTAQGLSTSTISAVAGSFSELQTIDLTNGSAADAISSVADKALSSLTLAPTTRTTDAAATPDGVLRTVSSPTIKQLSFGDANELSIGLRALSPEDMLKAAAAHMELDLDKAIFLIVPREKERNESKLTEQEKQKRSDEAPQIGIFYGDHAPSAMVGVGSRELTEG